MRYGSLALTVALACASGCGSGRTYTLTGQVIAIDSARREITIRHRDIPGFMSAMTMPFKVQDKALIDKLGEGKKVDFEFEQRGKDSVITAVK